MTPYKVGDVLRFKSGGEPCTVTKVNPDGTVRIVWRAGDRVHELNVLAAAMEYAPGYSRAPAPPHAQTPSAYSFLSAALEDASASRCWTS
jgi:uncharacterized protein YodC (DUF2158 family)